MSVIRVGSTGTYAEGWDAIFGGSTKRAGGAAGKKKAAIPTKQATKKAAAGGRKPLTKALQAKARRRK